jgi:hypothetical protein
VVSVTNTTYPFPHLIDCADDGYMDERGHLAIDLASTPEEAVEAFVASYRDASDGTHPLFERENAALVCVGRVWLIAEFTVYGDNDWTQRHVADKKLLGIEAEKRALAEIDGDRLWFVKCDPDADGAREWWKIEVVDACSKLMKVYEQDEDGRDDGDADYCGLPKDHDGDCKPREDY